MPNENSKSRLSVVKFLELAFAVACLVLHFYSFNDGDITTSFLATGTFTGFILIEIGLFAGILMRAPIHKRIDIFLSVVGCCLFLGSGVLLIEAWEYSFRTRTRDMAIIKAALSIMLLMIGLGLLHFSFNDICLIDTVIMIHGVVVAFTILNFLSIICKIYKTNPGFSYNVVLNIFGFILFGIAGILLITRSDTLIERAKALPYLEDYNVRGTKKQTIMPLNNPKWHKVYLAAGILALINAICFLIEIVWDVNHEDEISL